MRLRQRRTLFPDAVWFNIAVAFLALAAALKLGSEFYRLVVDFGPVGAVDLRLRREDISWWFAGLSPYDHVHTAVYPPASYLLLWPLIGWGTWLQARLVWALVMLVSLVGFSGLLVRQTGARGYTGRWFAALMLLSMNAAGGCVGNGQLSIPVVWLAALAVLLVNRSPEADPPGPERAAVSWPRDLAAALALLLSLVKPTLAAPFFWLVLFVPGRLRPALLVAAGYVGLTLLAAAFQEHSVFTLVDRWLHQAGADCLPFGSADLHCFLYVLGLGVWAFKASLLLLAGLGLWIWWYRRVDVWILLGVTALVARFWTYHGTYDDLMVVLAMVTLFRDARTRVLARIVLAAAVVVMLLPVTLHHFAPRPWPAVFAVGHTVVWLAMLGYLLVRAHEERRALRTGAGE